MSRKRKRKTIRICALAVILVCIAGIAGVKLIGSDKNGEVSFPKVTLPEKPANEWVIAGDGTSYVDGNGEAVTGWVQLTPDGETPNIEEWCYFDENGKYVDCFEEDQSGYSGIFVDISKQHLYHINDGVIDLKANIISGTRDKDDTPVGEYSVFNKVKNTHISGPDWDYDIACWIGFIGHEYGFHDAWWQDDALFDDPTTYHTSGSHGCINMRQDDILKLFDLVEEGTRVIIHK